MELRNNNERRTRNDYKDLQITLTGLGLFEDGMNLLEMRQTLEALQQSESSYVNDDLERALRESEMDFNPLPQEAMANSTMLSGNGFNANAERPAHELMSPDMAVQQLTVVADVHRPHDWSPPDCKMATAPPQLYVTDGFSPIIMHLPHKRRKLEDDFFGACCTRTSNNESGSSASGSDALSGLQSFMSTSSSGTSASGFTTDSLASPRPGAAAAAGINSSEEHQSLLASRSSVAISSEDNQSWSIEDLLAEDDSGDCEMFEHIFTPFAQTIGKDEFAQYDEHAQ